MQEQFLHLEHGSIVTVSMAKKTNTDHPSLLEVALRLANSTPRHSLQRRKIVLVLVQGRQHQGLVVLVVATLVVCLVVVVALAGPVAVVRIVVVVVVLAHWQLLGFGGT